MFVDTRLLFNLVFLAPLPAKLGLAVHLIFVCVVFSVCRLWRNCARRVLRTQQQLTYVSATGRSKTGVHVLCNILAEDVEVYTIASLTAN